MLKTTKTALSGIVMAMIVAGSTLAPPSAYAGSGYTGGSVYYVGGNNWKKGKWTGSGNKGGYYCRNCGGRYYGGYGYAPWVGPAIGFGTGLFVGTLLAQPRYYAPAPRYYGPAPRGYASRDAYCHHKYRSYNSRTGTYTAYSGKHYYCRIP